MASQALSTPPQAVSSVATPKKPSPSPVPDSPGNWNHPRLAEIRRRQKKTSFTEANVNQILYNAAVILGTYILHSYMGSYVPIKPKSIANHLAILIFRLLWAASAFNIATALLPLLRSKDDMSDIPLTAGQRKYLGLPPLSTPDLPGIKYSTPPRYLRTPSLSGSTGSKRSLSCSPLSGRTDAAVLGSSPANESVNGSVNSSVYDSVYGNGHGSGSLMGSGSPFTPRGSPLLQKAFRGARRSPLGSLGSQSPAVGGAGTDTGTVGSLLNAPDASAPSPATGKKSSIALNSKWRFEKDGRRNSGNNWL